MPSYSSWNGVKCLRRASTCSPTSSRGELGFEGFLISDYNAIDQLDKDYKVAVDMSINAGMDMVMVPTRYKEFIRDLKELVNEGASPCRASTTPSLRILRVKFAMGLLDPKAHRRSPIAACRRPSARPNIATSPARPCANRSCC